MCIMCVEIFKGRMTISEGRKALTELVATTEDDILLKHYKELSNADDETMEEIIAKINKSE
jgi:hypothetical protein